MAAVVGEVLLLLLLLLLLAAAKPANDPFIKRSAPNGVSCGKLFASFDRAVGIIMLADRREDCTPDNAALANATLYGRNEAVWLGNIHNSWLCSAKSFTALAFRMVGVAEVFGCNVNGTVVVVLAEW